MAELTHTDTADDAFHEIQLSGKQLVFLFMATTAVAVAIFLCGVQVGRNARGGERLAESQDTAAAAATASTPTASTPTASQLQASAAPAPAPIAESSGPPAAEPPAPAADADDKLSYADRLQGDKTPADKLKPESAAAAAATAPKLAPHTAAPSAPVKSAPAKPEASAASGAPHPGVWVVQLVALKDRSGAAAVAQQLTGKGYPAFVVSPPAGSPAIFRVQVGRYNDRHEAEQVARRLEKEGQFKPWISR